MASWYRLGTVSVENGSTTVTGALTAWLSRAKVGDVFHGPDLKQYEITSVAGNTGIEIYPAYTGSSASDAAYAIENTAAEWHSVSELSVSIAETAEAFQRGFSMVSLSEVEIGTGQKTFSVPAGLPILPGAFLTVASALEGEQNSHRMAGTVQSYSGAELVLEALSSSGDEDVRSSWNINLGGDIGPPGPENSLEIGDVVTSEPGSEANATITGAAPSQILNLVLPRGNIGPANSLEIGDVVTGDPGDPADAEITGAAPNQVLDLTIPRGYNGWSPRLAIVSDGLRRVLQVEGWVGGEGDPPASGAYVGADGLVADLEDAIDIRGPAGTAEGISAYGEELVAAEDAADARDVLELGSAATLDAGTAPTNVVQLDGAGKLPAVDGSQLTGLPPPVPPGYDQLLTSVAYQAMLLADVTNFAVFPAQDRFADSFDTLDYVDVAGATNLDTSTAGVLKPTTTSETAISGATGSNFGNMTGNGGLAAAYDGNTAQPQSAGAYRNSGGTGYVGKTYSGGKRISKVMIYATTDASFNGSGSGGNSNGVTHELYGKLGSVPANDTDGDLLGTLSQANNAGSPRTVSSGNMATVWDHVWVRQVNAAGTECNFSEVVFYEPGTVHNLTVSTTGLPLVGEPEVMSAFVLVREIDSVTPGTDWGIRFSRNNGADWEDAPPDLIRTVPISGGITLKLYDTDRINMTGEAFATACKMQMWTANAKMVQFHAHHTYGA